MLKWMVFALMALPSVDAQAGVCDYRLSALLGSGGSGGAIAATAEVAGSDMAMKAAGFYLITNYTTGMTMVASTAAGASAAGTVGIIGGTSGVLGSAAAAVSAPITLTAAALAAIGAAGMEAGCYFVDERITDPKLVLEALRRVAETASPLDFMLSNGEAWEQPYILVRTGSKKYERYDLENLYIVNGELMNSDWFMNTDIGRIEAKS